MQKQDPGTREKSGRETCGQAAETTWAEGLG